jgi:double-stranded uracil-DNA glycosylase
MALIHGFEPLAQRDAHTLILGSMPSRESLRQARYYAHPRNSFWPLVAELLRLPDEDYPDRTRRFSNMGYAVWDVLQSCSRASSLDSAIVDSSIQPNDFGLFYIAHPRIDRVFFNGAKAELMYRRHVLDSLPPTCQGLSYQRLPSTSPANAGMTLEEKRRAWREILGEGD